MTLINSLALVSRHWSPKFDSSSVILNKQEDYNGPSA
jgi:hypothetical protein